MKVTIIEEANTQTEIIIKCNSIDDEILSLVEKLKKFKEKILVYNDKMQTLLVPIKDILYCEYVDRTVYLYTIDKIYITNDSLNDLEESKLSEDFFRCSKSFIINICHIQSFKSDLSGRLIATLTSEEKICISRHYSKKFKEKLYQMR
ncbi:MULTISPECIES: LytTR family DNA-binding domain-containing protein [unclassified Fusibacter]|uniref:LytTR family DNA-binding domain-containing protein n=1 Tax=unclassified Fusibacter TaxID=2624464 RepID=UPI00101178B7|nr:LytTR family DNA-binding domain-containing protein [Fusibacter sp. A1]MCK8061693.1 LytTR family transcriptional regulator DNA-binding domain-containing protein [Fusibacter sp. A2]NPE23862.1 LytTR family transcriptional regulator [Fusibacter sp. A1]RXV58538.1 LytTR family transcriptional regulator [Fusibacter sp. A1]